MFVCVCVCVCVSVDGSFQFTVSVFKESCSSLRNDATYSLSLKHPPTTTNKTTLELWSLLDNAAFHAISDASDNSSSAHQLNVEGH